MTPLSQILHARTHAFQQLDAEIAELGTVATELAMPETHQYLEKLRQRAVNDTFNVIVLGRFKTGKTTLVNALLGRLTKPVPELCGKGAMPTSPLPCTAILTSIRYSDTPYVKVWKMDGKWEDWSLERYLKNSHVCANEKDTQVFFANIREFEIGLPVELCQQGITLWDSPGLDDTPERDLISKKAVEMCDVAIVNYRSLPPLGEYEREFSGSRMRDNKVHVFSVINMSMGLPTDDQFKSFVCERLTATRGEKYNGEDPATRHIFFVNAQQAEQGRLDADDDAVQQSGILELEQRLGEFLVTQRLPVHLASFRNELDIQRQQVLKQLASNYRKN